MWFMDAVRSVGEAISDAASAVGNAIVECAEALVAEEPWGPLYLDKDGFCIKCVRDLSKEGIFDYELDGKYGTASVSLGTGIECVPPLHPEHTISHPNPLNLV